MGTGSSFPGVKRPGRETDNSPQTRADAKNSWNYISTPPYVFMAWHLVKHVFRTKVTKYLVLRRLKKLRNLEYYVTRNFVICTGQLVQVRWVPCHHDMARPQVADGQKASRYAG
jgi:hypothetical protein